MAKDLRMGILLDFYGGLLTEKQSYAMDCYYNQDLSLSEIADDMEISRQGVMAFLRQGERHLRDFEEKLGLAERFSEVSVKTQEMRDLINRMPKTEESDALLDLVDSVLGII